MFLDGPGSAPKAWQLFEAMSHAVEVSIVARHRDRWLTFYTHITSLSDASVSLLLPRPFDPAVAFTFQAGMNIGLSFKLGSDRFVCATRVLEVSQATSGGIITPLTLVVALPAEITKLSNRVYRRLKVPEHKNVSCFFWPGGIDVQPTEDTPQVPSWVGKVLDLSVGGCRVLAHRDVLGLLAEGDLVGMIIQAGNSALFSLDAHLTRAEPAADGCMFYGMRFSLMRQTLQAKLAAEGLRQLLLDLAA